MPTTGGFIVGLTLAKEARVPKEEQASLALVGGLMPTPLIGALVVQGMLGQKKVPALGRKGSGSKTPNDTNSTE